MSSEGLRTLLVQEGLVVVLVHKCLVKLTCLGYCLCLTAFTSLLGLSAGSGGYRLWSSSCLYTHSCYLSAKIEELLLGLPDLRKVLPELLLALIKLHDVLGKLAAARPQPSTLSFQQDNAI